jgi:hypothetical protein
MTDAAQEPPAIDPDNVPETLCLGRFNVTVNPPLVTLTFTHRRPKVGPLVDQNIVDLESVVRARIVTTIDNLVGLRDLLNNIIQDPTTPAASAGGSSKMN